MKKEQLKHDPIRDKIVEITYKNIFGEQKVIFGGQMQSPPRIPRISFNGRELIQLIKIPPTICGNEFIFKIPLQSSEINFRRIIEYYMPIVTRIFTVGVNNIKFFFNTESNQQKSIYVVISNTDINNFISMYNSFVNDYANDIPSMICPQLTTTTQGAGGAVIGGSGGGGAVIGGSGGGGAVPLQGITGDIVVTPESTTQQPFVLDQNPGEVVF